MKTTRNGLLSLCLTPLVLWGAASAEGVSSTGGKLNGGGGGGSPTHPLTPITGTYTGTAASGAPVQQLAVNLVLNEDPAGNLSGLICIQACSALTGRASASPFFPFGVFQFRAGDNQFNGIVEGPVACTNGITGMWIDGSFQNRGRPSTFTFTTCP